MHRSLIIAAILCTASASNAKALELGINFSGSVLYVFGDPYQASISVFPPTPVMGHVVFDANSAASHPIAGCDCMEYRQQIPGGFVATFGDLIVRADDFVVQVKNNMPQSGGPTDTLSIVFAGSFSPPLAAPLWVNDQPFPDSWFQINFDGPSNSFPDAGLPQTLDLSQFSSFFNFLDEVPDSQINVVFRNTAFSAYRILPGDYDLNGRIDEEDREVWQRSFGQAFPLHADGNRNARVDVADYIVWRMAAANSSFGAAARASVPEPASLALVLIALGFVSKRVSKGRVAAAERSAAPEWKPLGRCPNHPVCVLRQSLIPRLLVIPARAGILRVWTEALDSRLRGNDDNASWDTSN